MITEHHGPYTVQYGTALDEHDRPVWWFEVLDQTPEGDVLDLRGDFATIDAAREAARQAVTGIEARRDQLRNALRMGR